MPIPHNDPLFNAVAGGPTALLLMAAAFCLVFSWLVPSSEVVVSRSDLLPVSGLVVRSYASPAIQSSGCSYKGYCAQHGEPAHVHVIVAVDGRGDEDFVQDPGVTTSSGGLMQLQRGTR